MKAKNREEFCAIWKEHIDILMYLVDSIAPKDNKDTFEKIKAIQTDLHMIVYKGSVYSFLE